MNDYYEFTISKHFMSAIINNDYSGLDDCEETQLNLFIKYLPVSEGFWSIDDDDTENFATCEIIGLLSDCCIAKYYYHNPSIEKANHD